MDSYEDVQEYYARNWSHKTGDDESPDWHDLPYTVQCKIEDDYYEYKKAYVENEERELRPYSYYGVSR